MVTRRRTLALALRELANRLDRAAWQAEMDGLVHLGGKTPAAPLIDNTRQEAQRLRRLAQRLTPTKQHRSRA